MRNDFSHGGNGDLMANNWKEQIDSTLKFPERNSPAHILTLAQWDPC